METSDKGFDYRLVPWKAVDAVVVFALAWIGLPFLVVLIVRQLGPYVPLLHTFGEGLNNQSIGASFVFSIIDALAGFGLLWLYLRRYHANWKQLGWRPFSPAKAVLFFVLTIVAFIALVAAAYAIVSILYPGFNAGQAQSNEFSGANTADTRRLSFLALVVIPPIIEETVFRGFMFPAFAKRFGGVWGAIITSIFFAIAHLQLNVSVYTLVLSLLLCLMYVRLKSIIPGIFFHMFNNYLAYTVLIK